MPEKFDDCAVIKKNHHTEIRVALTEFKDSPYLDCRQFELVDASGEFRPTRRGVTIPPRHIPAFREAIEKMEFQAREQGLIVDVVEAPAGADMGTDSREVRG